MIITEFARGTMSSSFSAIGYWGMALAARLATDLRAPEPPVPAAASADDVVWVRGEIRKLIESEHA